MRTLAEVIERDGRLRVRDAIGWTLRSALSVWLLHSEGRIHGRLSLSAIAVASADCGASGELVAPEKLLDAPAFHSRDRIEGGRPSEADDLWALGVMLYVLLTAEMPFPDGVAAAIQGERIKHPKALAMVDPNLDVMQPLLDRMVHIDAPYAVTSVDELVGGLRDFSPAIANLPPLSLPQPTLAALDAPGPTGRDWRRSWKTVGVAVVVPMLIGIGIGAGVLMLDETDSAPASPAVSPPLPVAPPPPPSSPMAPPQVSVATNQSGGDMVACLSPMFAGAAFPVKIARDFPCRETNPVAIVDAVSQSVVEGSARKDTAATREWSQLGWYRPAAVALARARCCSYPPPLKGPPLLKTCDFDAALAGLTDAATGNDEVLAQAIENYRDAIACVATAEGGPLLKLEGDKPSSQQAALFLRLVTRLRRTD
ncbi:MAG: hypothetical protein AAGA56_16215 [Myxococcota bacterium]